MRSVLAHGHIFKNAGTTLDWSLQRCFGPNFLDHRDDEQMCERGASHLSELVAQQPGIVALSSHHLCRPLPDAGECEFVPVFLLRHPIERIASVYSFERRQETDTAGAKAAKEKSFRDYVKWRMLPSVFRTIRDYQVAYLAGTHSGADNGPKGMELFELALEAVRSTPVVGVVDRYDESMVLIEYHLKERFPSLDLAYVPQNVTGAGLFRRRESSASAVLRRLGPLRHEVVDNNSLDLAMYQIVNSRLDKMIGSIDDFEQRLLGFRKRCELLQGSAVS